MIGTFNETPVASYLDSCGERGGYRHERRDLPSLAHLFEKKNYSEDRGISKAVDIAFSKPQSFDYDPLVEMVCFLANTAYSRFNDRRLKSGHTQKEIFEKARIPKSHHFAMRLELSRFERKKIIHSEGEGRNKRYYMDIETVEAITRMGLEQHGDDKDITSTLENILNKEEK